MLRQYLLPVFAVSALLSACADDTITSSKPSPAAVVAAAPNIHISGEERFGLDLTISGDPRPNAPLQVHAVAHGLLNTSNAEVAIYFPEADAAERGGWQRLVTLPGQRVGAAATVSASALTGAALTANAVFQVPVAGYYRVLAVVRKLSGEGDVAPDGHVIQPSLYKELWVFADSTNGKITPTFDPSVVPDSLLKRPGPARSRAVRNSQSGLSSTIANLSRAPRQRESTLMSAGDRRLVFLDSLGSTPTYSPAAGVTVHTQECQYVDGQCFADWYDGTDANGQYVARCPDSWDYYISGEFRYDEGGFTMYSNPTGGGTYEDLGSCLSEGGDAELASAPTAVYEHLLMIVDSSAAHFTGFSPGGFNVIITDPGCLGTFNGDCGNTTFYQLNAAFWDKVGVGSGVNNSMYVMQSGPNRSVFNDYGWFAVAHEFGHALHARSLGGIYHNGDCGSTHTMWTAYNMGCAWEEGFADYHAAAILSSKTALLTSGITGTHSDVSNGRDIEGEVARTLYNLARGSSNLGDTYIAQMVRDCRLSGSHITGADYLVYCAEESISTDATNHFSAYNSPPSTVSWPSPPASWNLSTIRSVWHHYLFNE
jgi:hypothetical protein